MKNKKKEMWYIKRECLFLGGLRFGWHHVVVQREYFVKNILSVGERAYAAVCARGWGGTTHTRKSVSMYICTYICMGLCRYIYMFPFILL